MKKRRGMGLFNSKELAEIERLKEIIQTKDKRIRALEDSMPPEMKKIQKLDHIIAEKRTELRGIESKIEELKDEINKIIAIIAEKKNYVIELDDTILLQEFGLYEPLYDFATSDEYKTRLNQIRDMQKEMIKGNTAAVCEIEWTIDGDKRKGKTFTTNNIKQILRSFNTECENAIDRVKFNNIDSMKARIQKSYDDLNKINSSNKVTITYDYLNLKMNEIHLAIEWAMKKQEEKEELRRLKEEQREQAKAAKEMEEARKEIEKEQNHYNNVLKKLGDQIEQAKTEEQKKALIEKKDAISHQIEELDKALKDVDYRAANMKAGYVYVISNIGSFGEHVYKIGMTRRLDPMDRIYELGDASVPFNFDVHAMVFSDDAPSLEAALHRAFDKKKLNMINTRREFFRVTLDEIEKVIKKHYDKTVDFCRTPPAEQYRESMRILESL
jgi:chromosome segregation ATPase